MRDWLWLLVPIALIVYFDIPDHRSAADINRCGYGARCAARDRAYVIGIYLNTNGMILR